MWHKRFTADFLKTLAGFLLLLLLSVLVVIIAQNRSEVENGVIHNPESENDM